MSLRFTVVSLPAVPRAGRTVYSDYDAPIKGKVKEGPSRPLVGQLTAPLAVFMFFDLATVAMPIALRLYANPDLLQLIVFETAGVLALSSPAES